MSLPSILREASGLEVSRSGYLWTHNDDGMSVLYGLDSVGTIIKAIHLNHPNKGWEDLTQDDRGNFYVGAFGNNRNDRKDLAIYKIANPESIQRQVVNAEIIQYSYPDQNEFPPSERQRNFDADALVGIGDSLYLFTKNRTHPFTGYTKIYRLPAKPGKYEAVLHDSIYLGKGEMMEHWVTGADVSPDGKWLALLSHQCVWMITGFKDNHFSSGRMYRVPLNHYSHKTGLCFFSDTKILIVDELEFGFLGGRIYAVDLSEFLRSIPEIQPTNVEKAEN